MSEQQRFGFDIESMIINKYGLKKNESYTGVYDAMTQSNINVQIKTFKNKTSVCLGDLKRNFSKSEPFVLIIYNYDTNFNHIKTHFLKVKDYKKYNELFYFEKYNEFYDQFMLISNSYDDDDKWKLLRLKYTNMYKETHDIVKMNPKRDHKKQKRIQCSIPYKLLKTFMDNFEEITEEEFIELNLKGELNEII